MTRGALLVLRLAAGPAALVGFFLPWAEGPGPLASVDFTGYSLVGFTGHLSALDLGPAPAAALLVLRLAILSAGIAAFTHSLLSAGLTWHPAYRVTGWWLSGAAPLAWILSLALSGDAIFRPGTAFLAAGAVAFVLAEVAERWGLRGRESSPNLLQQVG